MSFLGSGLIDLGERIDWHADFRGGGRWPQLWHEAVPIVLADAGSDAKVPWELSRGHQLLTLARAACLFRDERYAFELERQLSDWIDANPPGTGINWTNPMEVAIRAVNWLWALGTLDGWRPASQSLRGRVARSLQVHARHIRVNLEESPRLRGNHYLADMLGLLALGGALPQDPAAERWRRCAHRALEREVLAQVHADGVGFEASLAYHGLSLEMFLVARRLASLADDPFSGRYDERLRRMLQVSRAVRHPDSRTPQVGDSDSGRILPAGFARAPTHDPIIWVGAALLGVRPLPGEPHEEVAWTLGLEAWHRACDLPEEPEPPSMFPNGGLYVLRAAGVHVVVHCGDVGQRGVGGHAHNDTLSFEASWRKPLIIDPGTYAYTGDPAERNRFRATRAHNTVVVDGEEIHPIDPAELFVLTQRATPSMERFAELEDAVLLVASHDGYSHLSAGGVVHRREMLLGRDDGTLTVRDRLAGEGEHALEAYLHLAAGTIVKREAETVLRLLRGEAHVQVRFEGFAGRVEIEDACVSDGYGVREAAPVLVVRGTANAPTEFSWTFEPQGALRPSNSTAPMAAAG